MTDAGPDGTEPDDPEEPEQPDDHLEDLPDGSGCTEIWEYISERRDDDD